MFRRIRVINGEIKRLTEERKLLVDWSIKIDELIEEGMLNEKNKQSVPALLSVGQPGA